jgi:hypothetical protein
MTCARTLPGLLTLLAMLAGLAVPASAGAAGATYTVIQCDPLNREADDATMESSLAYDVRDFCGSASQDNAIKVSNVASAGNGRYGRVRWAMPSSALGIVGVSVEGKLRRDSQHRARLWMGDDSFNETFRVATGGTDATAFQRYAWSGAGQDQFIASLSCEEPDGCPQSDEAKTWVRNVRLTLKDYADPVLTRVDGTLLGGGWVRGSRDVEADGSDSGSGLDRIRLLVNGVELDEQPFSCSAISKTSAASRLRPCVGAGGMEGVYDTTNGPFTDGGNTVAVCALDFAGNVVCASENVDIDNTPPKLAFSNAEDPDDPELIRAPISDPHSGVASGQIWFRKLGDATWRPLDTEIQSGELRARVDTEAEEPGHYQFMAEATDVAGNHIQTTERQNGDPMVVSFPLRAGSELSAHLEPGGERRQTIRYGRASEVAGQLVDTEGDPLRNQPVTVEEYFGEGALIERRVRTVRTDSDGHWLSKLPAGPSRTVTATYDGNAQFLGADADAGVLRVRSKASFRTSRSRIPEGGRIVFKGRVGHLGARLPSGGKLIELQVQEAAGRWNTVREAFYTKPDGRYKTSYRFGRFYQADAVFRFRAKVAREQGWPYKAPVRSRSRKVTVLAR